MCRSGFHFTEVVPSDVEVWIDSKKACYKKYVDRYYSGWNDQVQAKMNSESFAKAMQMRYFRKITLAGEIVGFCGYDEAEDRIFGVTIHMYESARNHGIGSDFLRQLTEYSKSVKKPVYLKVFKTNPARRLYERFGFEQYDETDSHYLMVYNR